MLVLEPISFPGSHIFPPGAILRSLTGIAVLCNQLFLYSDYSLYQPTCLRPVFTLVNEQKVRHFRGSCCFITEDYEDTTSSLSGTHNHLGRTTKLCMDLKAKMMVSDEEKRWLVFGLAMNKVAVPVLRRFVQQGIVKHYKILDMYCRGLATPNNLQALTSADVAADPMLKHLKFQNINNNLLLHARKKILYDYGIHTAVDLAKLYLPEYLTKFSGFDESLDISAILRLLGFDNPAPIFSSPNLFLSIQCAANDVRENVRNKWGHCNFNEWSEVFFSYCFAKLKLLIRSLGLTDGTERITLDQLNEWEAKGCQLCIGHAIDQNVFTLLQQDVAELIDLLKKSEAAWPPCQGSPVQQGISEAHVTKAMDAHQVRNEKHSDKFQTHEMGEEDITVATLNLEKENKQILDKLASIEGLLSVKLQDMEKDLTETSEKVKELEQESIQMKKDITCLYNRQEPCPMRPFDVSSCRKTLASNYQRNARVPTSVWSSRCTVDIHEIYTRLSWVKQEQSQQNPSGNAQSKLKHYTDIFAQNRSGAVPKRILVQGMPGIGKSTFVKKLAVDWAELNTEEGCDNGRDALRKFEIVVVINLREVSHCSSLRDALTSSYIFPLEEGRQLDDLLDYIVNYQENVLLVFDGYDEYRCGRNSELYQIFRGNSLRDCCVIVTSRLSKAGDLLEYSDSRAEITGFNLKDRKLFMKRILGTEKEAGQLYAHLVTCNLVDEARVPILLLFFSTLWKNGKSSSFSSKRTELYLAIVQCILDYGEGRCTPPRFGKVDDYADILAEVGKVALESLLEDDLLFEYHRLSDAVLCEKSTILGFLQIIDCVESLHPACMVSFIHKSIQEFLAAWYITHKCIPNGTLFGSDRRALTFEDCESLDNVFQFVCGLSNKGAERVFQHLQSLGVSDQTLDISKTVPCFQSKPVSSSVTVTTKQRRFQDLVFNSFRECQSPTELLKLCFDCTGGTIFVPGELSELGIPKVHDITQVLNSGVFIFEDPSPQVLQQSLNLLGCVEISLRLAENSQSLQIHDVLRKIVAAGEDQCGFTSVLAFQNREIRFFITELYLHCDDHARLLAQIASKPVQSCLADSSLQESCLKFLRCLRCYDHGTKETMKDVGAMVAACDLLTRIETEHVDDCVCDLLEQVRNPSACCLEIGYYRGRLWLHYEGTGSCTLTSDGIVRLANLLPKFPNTTILSLRLPGCGPTAVDKLVPNITHTSLKLLELCEVCLTPEAAAHLGRAIPEMGSLKILQLSSGEVMEQHSEQLKLLFSGFKQPSSLGKVALKGFRVTSGLSSFTDSLRFLPHLKVLHLKDLRMDEQDLGALVGNFQFIGNLKMLNLKGNSFGRGVRSIVEHIHHLPMLQFLVISRPECLEEDWNYVAESLKMIHPKLKVS